MKKRKNKNLGKPTKRIEKQQPLSPPPPPDRRGMEKMMSDITSLLHSQDFDSIDDANAFLQQMLQSGQPVPSMGGDSPIDQAQQVMYQAWDERHPAKRIQLAQQALTISKDCADAYVLLAEEQARTVEEANKLYAQGVEAGKRAIGDEFDEWVEHFWGITETRPYMRACEGLMQTLWYMGKSQEAITHANDMLRLNPNDNQGIRYFLLTALLTIKDFNAANKLIAQYDDDVSAQWTYNRVVALFYAHGDHEKTKEALLDALRWNEHVPTYLLDKRKLPKTSPAMIQFGDTSEAIDYAHANGHLWHENKKLLAWLKQTMTTI